MAIEICDPLKGCPLYSPRLQEFGVLLLHRDAIARLISFTLPTLFTADHDLRDGCTLIRDRASLLRYRNDGISRKEDCLYDFQNPVS